MSPLEKHVVLGTAGHIDHGKTELIRALTGVDTDRLSEEKERGISIELGFARLDLPGGASLGVVDVPGHERFVKTMLAGAAGIDIILLVVAADEGVMPQTREHMNIVDLLGIDNGVVALTKLDLVSPEELELARDDVREFLEGTVFERMAVMPVSSVTGEGLDDLREELARLAEAAADRSSSGPARLPVDRVFSLAGHGTIVTGTLWSGTVRRGDRLEVYPRGLKTRIRSVQVHDSAVDAAVAGQRTALGLHGVSKDELERGDTVAAPGALSVSHMLDARLRLVAGGKPLANRARVHLHLGTAEVLARVVLLEGDTLDPGADALVQLRLEEPVASSSGDLFVIRSYSPVTTIGGGRVVDASPRRHARMRDGVIESLQVLESGGDDDVALQLVSEAGIEGLLPSEAAGRVAGETLSELLDEGRLVEAGGRLLTRDTREELARRIEAALVAHARGNPLAWGMSVEELRGRLSKRLDRGVLDAALSAIEAAGRLARRGDQARWGSAEMALPERQARLADAIVARLLEAGAAPPSAEELSDELNEPDFDAIVRLLAESGRIVKVTSSLFMHPDVVDSIRSSVLAHFEGKAELSVADFKDMAGVTRKHAIPILEFLDREGTTARAGNVRRKGRGRT